MPRNAQQLTAVTLLALLLLGGFLLLGAAVQQRGAPAPQVDHSVSAALQSTVGDHPWLVCLMQAASDVGRPVTWWVVHTLTVVLLLIHRQIREALFVVVTAGGGGLLTTALKSWVGRHRPEWPDPVSAADGFAFPSGHTAGTAIGVCVLLIVLLRRLPPRWHFRAAGAGLVLVLMVGASRAVLGVHWLSDVVGALLFSGGWVLLMLVAFRPGAPKPARGQ